MLALIVGACGPADDGADESGGGAAGPEVGEGDDDLDRSEAVAGGSSNGAAGDTPGDGAADGSSGSDQTGSRSGSGNGDGEELSVLGAYLGYEIPGLDQGDAIELRRIEQETIERCMRAEGFAYVAWVEDPAVVYAPVEEGLDPESRDFAATYGFGVSTQFYAQRDVGPGLVGHTGDGSGVDFQDNPNDAIRAGLSPAELAAYERAFFGADSPMFDRPTAADGGDEDDGGIVRARELVAHGCIGEAQRAIDGEAGPVLDVFAVEILGLGQRAMADERYVAWADGVERCVNEAGFDFYRQRPPWAVLAHFDALVFEFDADVGGSPFATIDEAELAAMSAEEIDALYDLPRDIPDGLLGRLAEIQDLETRTAVALWDCGGNAAEQRRVLAEITAELQADFIATNRDDLERFRRS